MRGMVLCIAFKLRKEFKIDKPEQAERSSGYSVRLATTP
jgi:hypothetical protein